MSEAVAVQQQQLNNRKKPGGCTGKGFMPGQSGNPGGRPVGSGHMSALRAFADAKPNGDDQTNLETLIAAVFKRAIGGSSRHAQLILDRLVPHKSIRVTEETRTVNVIMQIAQAPDRWEQPLVGVDVDGDARLLGRDDSDDVD